MHEAALMRALVREIERVAAAQGARRVHAVTVWLGALAHFTPAHFRTHFEAAAAGTLAAGAQLELVCSEDRTHPDAQHVRLEALTCED